MNSAEKYCELVKAKNSFNMGDVDIINDVNELCNSVACYINNSKIKETFSHKFSVRKNTSILCFALCFFCGFTAIVLTLICKKKK